MTCATTDGDTLIVEAFIRLCRLVDGPTATLTCGDTYGSVSPQVVYINA